MGNFKVAVIVILVVLGVWFFGSWNSLVDLKEDVNVQLGQVETNLQRRADLIPNLVSTVQGYAKHEKEVFTAIADARSKLAGSIDSGDVEQISEANAALDSAIGRLLAISENYPDLQASQQFIALQDELAGTENRIAVSRQYYNEAVGKYNKAIQHLPTNIIASLRGDTVMSEFKATESAQQVPVVSFE